MQLMRVCKRYRAIVLNQIFWMFVTCSVFADTLDQGRKQQQRVEQELQVLQSELLANQEKTTKERSQLQRIETQLGGLYSEIESAKRSAKMIQETITELNHKQTLLMEAINEKETHINEILLLAYKQNNQPLIKLILSGIKPDEVARLLKYFSILTLKQRETLSDWIQQHEQLKQVAQETQKALAEQQALETTLAEKEQKLIAQKKERETLLTQLAKHKDKTQNALSQKQREQERLSNMIKSLEAEVEKLAIKQPENNPVLPEKGQLNWPVEGRLVQKYGRQIENTALLSQGVLIEAAEGSPVRAVHDGRVLFADFFKSNGLLIIIDHGQGIWSLYGRNRTLLVSAGALVKSGEVIAQVGQSGGYAKSGLYFEVRDKGTPINPAKWLTKR